MARDLLYRQCRLAKRIPGGEQIQISWIPQDFATLNCTVKLREPDGSWNDGWVVREVGANVLAEEELLEAEVNHRRFRKATSKD